MTRWRSRIESGLECGTRPEVAVPLFELSAEPNGSLETSSTRASSHLAREIAGTITDSRRITLRYADETAHQAPKSPKNISCRESQDPVAACVLSEEVSADENAQGEDYLRIPRWNRRKGRRRRGARGSTPEYRKWILPVHGSAEVSSPFGYRFDPLQPRERMVKFHNGLDLAAKAGTAVLAAAPGVVKYAGWRGALGLNVEVTHDDGYVTKYGHNSKLYTQVGKRVRQGDLIAAMGSTGRATGPHLHFEIRKNGVSEDPLPFLSRVCKSDGSVLLSSIPSVFRLGNSTSVSMGTTALISGLVNTLKNGAL